MYCPSCGTVLTPGTYECGDCGWTAPTEKPLVVQLANVISNVMASRVKWPDVLPADAHKAASLWLEMQEKPSRWEEQNPAQHKHRIFTTLSLFFQQTPNFQQIIMAAAEDGVIWRGEMEPVFMQVIKEYQHREEIGTDAYTKEARNYLKLAVKGQSR